MTEEQLIKACIKEDATAQKALFNCFSSKMLGVCHRYARTAADAEDILQDAFIKVFSKLYQFKFEGSFEGWLRRIVVNTAIKKYTISRYQKETCNYEEKENDSVEAEPPAFSNLSQKELLKLINSMPDGYRLIFNLHVIEGYPHEDIAKMLSIQPGTSRSQLVKARNMLQKQINELEKISL